MASEQSRAVAFAVQELLFRAGMRMYASSDEDVAAARDVLAEKLDALIAGPTCPGSSAYRGEATFSLAEPGKHSVAAAPPGSTRSLLATMPSSALLEVNEQLRRECNDLRARIEAAGTLLDAIRKRRNSHG